MRTCLLLLLATTSATAEPPPWCGTFAPERRPLVTIEAGLPLLVDVKLETPSALVERSLAHCFAGDVFIIVGADGVPLDVQGDNHCLVHGAWKLRFAPGSVRVIHGHIRRR